MKHFSVLLGAGFSVPDGYPTAWKLNQRLKKIDASEILIHSSGTSIFLNGEEDVNAMLSRRERYFVQLFLEFYNSNVLKANEEFHYENFYDYYSALRSGSIKDEQFDLFCNDFRKEYGDDRLGNSKLLLDFHNTFNQLVGSQLVKPYERVHLAKPYHPNYSVYLYLLEYLGKDFKVHIHSLNHDLLMEHLAVSDSLAFKFTDGFEELGSPYYGQHHKGYKIRLQYFTNKFDRTFCFYKLHGSINYIPYNFKNQEIMAVKTVYGIGMTEYFKEYVDQDGNLKYDNCWWNYFPDFLSGTTEKIKRYSDQYYYKKVFDHFENNLSNSQYLISIGYGFMDSEINRFIKELLLSRPDTLLLVVDPKPENAIRELVGFTNVEFLAKGVSDITLDEVESALKITLKRNA